MFYLESITSVYFLLLQARLRFLVLFPTKYQKQTRKYVIVNLQCNQCMFTIYQRYYMPITRNRKVLCVNGYFFFLYNFCISVRKHMKQFQNVKKRKLVSFFSKIFLRGVSKSQGLMASNMHIYAMCVAHIATVRYVAMNNDDFYRLSPCLRKCWAELDYVTKM